MEDIAVKIAELVGTLDDEEADELSMKSGGGGATSSTRCSTRNTSRATPSKYGCACGAHLMETGVRLGHFHKPHICHY